MESSQGPERPECQSVSLRTTVQLPGCAGDWRGGDDFASPHPSLETAAQQLGQSLHSPRLKKSPETYVSQFPAHPGSCTVVRKTQSLSPGPGLAADSAKFLLFSCSLFPAAFRPNPSAMTTQHHLGGAPKCFSATVLLKENLGGKRDFMPKPLRAAFLLMDPPFTVQLFFGSRVFLCRE